MNAPHQQAAGTRSRKRAKPTTEARVIDAPCSSGESDVEALLSRLEDTAWLTAQAISVGRRMPGGRRQPRAVAATGVTGRAAAATVAAGRAGDTGSAGGSARNSRGAGLPGAREVVLDPAARALLDALPLAVLWLNQHGIVQHCNAAALKRLGSPLLGETWRRIAAERLVAGADAAAADSTRASAVVNSNAFLNGQLVTLSESHSAAPVHAVTLTAAQHGRDRQLVRLGRLCAGLAHQLRTPIAAAQLYLDLAAASGDRLYLAKAQSALDALARHSESILTLSRGELLCEPDVSVATLLTLVQRQAQALRGRLHIETPAELPTLSCNLHLLSGALLNLVDNAIRASKSTEAHLKVLWLTDSLHFQVSDNGDGFPAHLLPLVGKALPSTRSDGAGLGLEMANMIVEAHGGALTIDPQAGGTCVCVRLPITATPPSLLTEL